MTIIGSTFSTNQHTESLKRQYDRNVLHEKLRDRTDWISAMAVLVGTDAFIEMADELQRRYGSAMCHLADEAGELAELMIKLK